MQCFIQKRDKKHIDQNQSGQAPYQYCNKVRFISFFIYNSRNTQPFAGGSAENALKESVVDKQCAEKEPAKSVIMDMIIHNIPLMHFRSSIRYKKNNQCIS